MGSEIRLIDSYIALRDKLFGINENYVEVCRDFDRLIYKNSVLLEENTKLRAATTVIVANDRLAKEIREACFEQTGMYLTDQEILQHTLETPFLYEQAYDKLKHWLMVKHNYSEEGVYEILNGGLNGIS